MLPDTPTHPATDPVDLTVLVRVLDIAAATAQRSWHPVRCDIYHCLSRAWRANAMAIPYTVAIRPVRDHVQHTSGADVLEFNDFPGVTASDVTVMFVSVRDLVIEQLAAAVAVRRLRPPAIATALQPHLPTAALASA